MRFTLEKVTKARNLELIGWNDGYVLAQFRGRSQQYVYGPQIPRAEVDKVLHVPFPDRQFKLAIQDKYQCKKL